MTYVGTLVGTDTAAGNVTSMTLQWADAAPSGTQSGDTALLFWTHTAATFTPGTEPTTPAGFTLEKGQVDGVPGIGCWKRTCDGTESGSITIAMGGATRQTAVLAVFRGYSGVNASAGGTETGSDAVHPYPSATPSVADVGVVVASGEREATASTAVTSYPAGYTEAAAAAATGASGSFTAVAYEGSAGSVSGTHTSGVAISPGSVTHNVSSGDAPTLTILLTPSVSAYNGTATVSETTTVTAAGQVGKAVGATRTATATVTAAGVVGKATGASVSATAAITAAGVVGKATGASISATATVTAAGSTSSGIASDASLPATATVTAAGEVGLADGPTLAATVAITAGGVVSAAERFFEPPTVAQGTNDGTFFSRYRMPVGQSVVRIDGQFQTLPFPWMGELIGAEGTDWFLGGRRYQITSEVAAELEAAGYTTE